jgi:hypothetical protein
VAVITHFDKVENVYAPFFLELTLLRVTGFRRPTPDGDVDGEVRRSERVGRLAGVAAGVVLLGVGDLQLRRHPLHFPDFSGARFSRQSQVLLAVLEPFDAENFKN